LAAVTAAGPVAVKAPSWLGSRTARRWLVAAAVVLAFLGGRMALQSFGVETGLSGDVRAYATCKPPWEAARLGAPGKRFTLFVMTGAAGGRRGEGVAALGSLCQSRARRRVVFATVLLAGGAVLAWSARPDRMRA
jgi:hypothetical protein